MHQAKTEQLSQVAKGWCKTIRASQVIPVYPLTQDIQVGDVFIVQRPIEDEAQIYDEKGFLPLGFHLDRLKNLKYTDFYQGGAHGVDGATDVPLVWERQQVPSTLPSKGNERVPAVDGWSKAPRAAFPSYSFTVKRSGALDLNLPVQGVPIGLGILGADSATASVSLKDAYTYGLDYNKLQDAVDKWKSEPANHKTLKELYPRYRYDQASGGSYVCYNYLRVVTRAYLVRKVTVSLVDARSGAVDFTGGAARNIKLQTAATQPSDMKEWLDVINTGLAGTQPASPLAETEIAKDASPLPGGRLKVVSITNRSVSLDETFDCPLLIGYLAYDIPIGFDGELGVVPVATQLRLKYARGTLSHTQVEEWIENNPQAEKMISAWASSGDNPSWLVDHGYYVQANEAKHPYDGKQLIEYIRHSQQFWRLDFWNAHVFDFKRTVNQLNRRIIAEVIERPEGLPFAAFTATEATVSGTLSATIPRVPTTQSTTQPVTLRPETVAPVNPKSGDQPSGGGALDAPERGIHPRRTNTIE